MKRLASFVLFGIAALVIVFLIALTLSSQVLDAPTNNPSASRSANVDVDKLFAKWDRPDSPGCSLGVSRNGVPVYDRGYGMANLELGVPITPASVFHVASVSKQFTAMSILLLAQRGKLSLDDEVGKYVPGWADKGDAVTIRHLLTQTSGLRDGFALEGLAPPREDGTDINDAIVNTLAATRGLNFRPGSEFQYNNSGYVLLGNIVKRVSGQSLRAFADNNIFKPLGMTHTLFHDDPTMIVPNRTYGYHQDAGGFHVAPHSDFGHLVGTTGLLTTAHDLLIWEQNFADIRVGDPGLIQAMQTPAISTGWWDKSSYGFGLEIAQYRGLRTVGHGGGDPGYGAFVVRYPDQGFAVALLCNLDNAGAEVGVLTERVADIYLSRVFSEPAMRQLTAPSKHISLALDELRSKVGLYYDPESESVGQVFMRDGKLMAREGIGEDEGSELIPVTPNRFMIPQTTIVLEFPPVAPGRPQELHTTGAGPKEIVSQRVAFLTLSSAELHAFSGGYTSQEVEGSYALAVRNSALVMQIPGRSDIALQPIFRDVFAGGLGVVKFSRDSAGVVTEFTLRASGLRGMRFDRVKQ